MRRLIFLYLLLIPLLGVAAPTTLSTSELAAHLTQRLDQAPILRADFTQEKSMAAFKKPLQTRGRLVFSRGKGVIWVIESPIKLTYVLAEDRIVEIGEDGISQVRTARDIPGLAQVASLFRALLGAQTDVLAENFTVTPEGTLDAWRLVLVPKPGPLAQAMREIRMSGGRHVDRIRIEEANGDSSTLVFRNTSVDRVLAPTERERFELR